MSETSSRAEPDSLADITVPIALMEGKEHESLRSPPHLDRSGIVSRLVEIREFDPSDAGGFFAGVEDMSTAQIGASVIGALTWLQDNPVSAHPFAIEQLQIVALNLKNLD